MKTPSGFSFGFWNSSQLLRNNPTQLLVEKSIISGFSSRIMQAQKEVLAKIVFLPF